MKIRKINRKFMKTIRKLVILFPLVFFNCKNSAINEKVAKGKDIRPNIVLILADDMGYSDLGCYGGEINTPNIDNLAYNGLRLTNFYNSGRCCPTRASLLTGLYPHQAGIGNMVYGKDLGGGYRGFINSTSVTLAEVLKKAGYKTLMSGKWHVGHRDVSQWPTSRGFDRFYGINIHVDSYWKVLENCDVYLDDKIDIPATETPVNSLFPKKDWYTTDVFTDYGINFLNEEVVNSEKDQPFFLYLAYNAPHWPLEAHDEDIKKYKGKYMAGWDKLREEKFERMKKMGIIPKNTFLSPPDNVKWDSLSLEDRKNLDFRRAIYAAQIDRLDQNVGRLVEYLKKIGKYENTLILFMSDNGCSAEKGMFGYSWNKNKIANYDQWKKNGTRLGASQGKAWANVSNVPFRLYKKNVHQGGIVTPFIAHWPKKINQNQINDHQGHIIDVMATLQDLANTNYPNTYKNNEITPLEGLTLVPLFEDKTAKNHKYIYWEHIGNKAIRKGEWKLVAESQKPWELYNLQSDPTELVNLVDDEPEITLELKHAYEEWSKKVGVREWPLKSK